MFASRRIVSRRSMSTAQESFLKVSQDLSKTTGQDLTKWANKLVGFKDSFLKEMEDPIMRGVGFLTLGFFAVVHHKRRNDKKHAAAHAAHDDHDDHHAVETAHHHAEAPVAAVAAPAEAHAHIEAAKVAALAPAPQAAAAAVQQAAPVAADKQQQQVKPILHQLGDVADRLGAIEKALGISK